MAAVSDINTLAGVADVLERISGQLIKIEGSQKNIAGGMPKLLGGFSGIGGGATGGTGSATGNSMPPASFGGVSSGGSGGPVVPAFANSKAGIAALAIGGAAWAVAPDPVMAMNNRNSTYRAGLGYANFGAGDYQNAMRSAMTGGIRSATDVAVTTATLNAYGIGPTQPLMMQAGRDTAMLNRTFNMGAEQASQMVGQMSSGTWIGNAYRYGMQMSDSRGNPLTVDQQYNVLYNRLWGGKKPTTEGIQNMYRAGGLQNQLSAMGMDQTQQDAFVKFALNRAGGGTASVAAMDDNKTNGNPWASSYKVGEGEVKKMDTATEAIINGYETAAAMIAKINQAYSALPDQAEALVAYTKAVTQGLGSNPTSSGLGGVLKSTFSALTSGAGAGLAFRAFTGKGAASTIANAARSVVPGGAAGAGGAAGIAGMLAGVGGVALTGGGMIAGAWHSAQRAGQGYDADTGEMNRVPGTPVNKPLWQRMFDSGAGQGDGGSAFSSTGMFASMSSGFDESSALSQFNVHSSASIAPSTLMGWVLQRQAYGQSASTPSGGSDPAPGGSSGGGKSLEDKRTKPQLHKRGQWETVAVLPTLSKGTNWTMGGQVNVDINSAKGSGRPGYMKTRWIRLGWGAQSHETASGDVTGVNTFVIPSGVKVHQQLLTPHTIAGGGPVAMQVYIEGRGTIIVTLALAKAKAWGRTDGGQSSRGGSRGSSAGTAGRSSASMNDLAGWFEAHLGDTKNPLTGKGFGGRCLSNVSHAVRETGGSFGTGWDSPAQIIDRGVLDGKLHQGAPPRGALMWWKPPTGGSYGHVAVADGKGNFLNNWGSAQNTKTPIERAGNNYAGWTYSNAVTKNKYSHGAWNIPKDETADIHSGEMILNAQNAELMRNAIREMTAGGKAGRKMEINLTITNATDAEAVRFAKKIKSLMEEESMLETMGSR